MISLAPRKGNWVAKFRENQQRGEEKEKFRKNQ